MWKSRFVIWDDSKYPLREKVSIMMGFICIGGEGWWEEDDGERVNWMVGWNC